MCGARRQSGLATQGRERKRNNALAQESWGRNILYNLKTSTPMALKTGTSSPASGFSLLNSLTDSPIT